MRISTQLVRNAATTYTRLGLNLLMGIFFIWYVPGEVGLAGFGAIALAAGSFGIGATVNYTIRQSVSRELAAALSTGEAARIERTVASAFAVTALGAVGVGLLMGALAGAAAFGVFNTPHGLAPALAAIFAAEGVIVVADLLLAPFSLALFASQRIGADNAFQVVKRAVSPVAAVLAFTVLRPDGDVAARLELFALLRMVLGTGEIAMSALVARLVVPRLRLRRRAFDAGACRTIAGTSWHTVQFTLAADLNPQLIMLLINLMFGLAFNGMWQIVIQVGGHARMLARGVLHGIDPMAAHLQEQGRRASLIHVMVRTVRYQLVQVLPFAAIYAVFLGPILTLWIGGRLAGDAHLAAAGITTDAAIAMITVMGVVNLAAELFRASTLGLERMLYGMDLVRTYAWFARWSVLLTVGLAGGLMVWFRTPVVAPIPLAAVQFVYFCVIVPRAAVRHAGLPVGAALRQALPRPILMTALLALPVAGLRVFLPPLTLPGLVVLLGVIGAMYVPLLLFVGLEPPERSRLREVVARGWRGE